MTSEQPSSLGYMIRGGAQGRERLRVLARVMAPTTIALLSRVGVGRGARCLDAGCGGGDVSVLLAALADEGSVFGVDVDEAKLDMARAEAAAAGVSNVTFLAHDVTGSQLAPGEGAFDVVYARFLLTHMVDSVGVLGHLAAGLASGGVLVVEDIDFRGHFCEPPSAAFDRYVELFTLTAPARGCDPHIGPRLPGMLAAAGLTDVQMNVVQPAGRSGEVKLVAPLTLEAIADAALAAGLTSRDEIDRMLDALRRLADDDSVGSLPRIVQAWARRG